MRVGMSVCVAGLSNAESQHRRNKSMIKEPKPEIYANIREDEVFSGAA